MKYCNCEENTFIKDGKCTTCGKPYDFTLNEDELNLKEQIKSILGIDETEFMNTPAKEIYSRLNKKALKIKSN